MIHAARRDVGTRPTCRNRIGRSVDSDVGGEIKRPILFTRRNFLRFVATNAIGCALWSPAQSSALSAPSADSALFETRQYRPIDLGRAAREQWGHAAQVTTTGRHLYDWKAVVGGKHLSLDLVRAVSRQYGRSWRLVITGLGLYDWKALRIDELHHQVLPVMLVSSDRFFDVAGVARGLDRYRSVLARVQMWYRRRAGATFRLLQPLIVLSGRNSSQWNDTCRKTTEDRYRFDLFHTATGEYGRHLPPPGDKVRVVLAPYTGDSPDVWQGAAAAGAFAVVPAYASSIQCPRAGRLSERSAGVAYAIGHELGHTFGLGHTNDTNPRHPRRHQSIMQTAVPPDAILLPGEIRQLQKSGFFR